MTVRIRLAEAGDVPALRRLIDASVRGLQARDYSPVQLEKALQTVYGVDTQLISDRTYFAAEEVDDLAESSRAPLLVGCGGWSRRKTLYGGDQFAEREDSLLDPARDAAQAAGFRRLEMGATLTGVPFYRTKGYVELEAVEAPLGDGLTLPIVRMGKSVGNL
jgi:hypothetical protein